MSGSLITNDDDRDLTLNGTRWTVTIHEDCDVRKLKSSKYDEFLSWKKNLERRAELKSVERHNQAPHVTLNALLDPEVHEVAIGMDWDEARGEDGLAKLMEVLYEHLKPKTSVAN